MKFDWFDVIGWVLLALNLVIGVINITVGNLVTGVINLMMVVVLLVSVWKS